MSMGVRALVGVTVALTLVACCSAQVSTRFYQLTNPGIGSRDVQARVRVFAGAALGAADIGTTPQALATYTTAVVNKINLSPFIPEAQCNLRWLPIDASKFTGVDRPAKLKEVAQLLSDHASAAPNRFGAEKTDPVVFLGYTINKRVVLRLATAIPDVTELLVLDLEKDYLKYLDCPTMSTNNQMYAVESTTSTLVYGAQADQEENGFGFLTMQDVAQYNKKVENSIVYRLTAPGDGKTETKMKVRGAPLGNIFLRIVRDWSFTVPDPNTKAGEQDKLLYLWQMPLAIVGGAVRDLYNAPSEAKDVDVAIGLPYSDVKQGLLDAYQAETTEVLNEVSLLSEGLRQQYGMLKVEKKSGEHDGLDIGPFKSFSKEELATTNYGKFATVNPATWTADKELQLIFHEVLTFDDNAKYLFGFSYRTDTKFRDFTINSLFLEVGNEYLASDDVIIRRLIDGGRLNTDDATGSRLGRGDVVNNVARPTGTTTEFQHDEGMWFRIWKMTNKGFCPSTLDMVDETCDQLDAWLTRADTAVRAGGPKPRDEEGKFFFRLRQKLFKVDDAKDKFGDVKAIVAQLHRMPAEGGVYKCFDIWTRIFDYVRTNFAAMCPTTLDNYICDGDVPRQTDLQNAVNTATGADVDVAKAKLKTFKANQKTYRMMLTAISKTTLTHPDVCYNNPAFIANGAGASPITPMTPFNAPNWQKSMCKFKSVKWDGGCPYHEEKNSKYYTPEGILRDTIETLYGYIENKAGKIDNVPYSLRYARMLAMKRMSSDDIQAPHLGVMTWLKQAVLFFWNNFYNAKPNSIVPDADTVMGTNFQLAMQDPLTKDPRQITMSFQDIIRATAKYYDSDLAVAANLIKEDTDKSVTATKYNKDKKTFIANNLLNFVESPVPLHHHRKHHKRHHRHHKAKHADDAFGSFMELGKRRRQN